jgi:hypothetical protein
MVCLCGKLSPDIPKETADDDCPEHFRTNWLGMGSPSNNKWMLSIQRGLKIILRLRRCLHVFRGLRPSTSFLPKQWTRKAIKLYCLDLAISQPLLPEVKRATQLQQVPWEWEVQNTVHVQPASVMHGLSWSLSYGSETKTRAHHVSTDKITLGR